MTAPGPAPEPRQRLHPLTPLLRSFRMFALAVAAISWQGYSNLGTARWLIAVAGVLVVTLTASLISWLTTGYHIVDQELRSYEGLLNRRARAIPLARLQSVEVVRSALARVFGLAELRLEVVGGAKTEAPLAFLTVGQATALRARLLAAATAARGTAPAAATATAAEGEPESDAAPVEEQLLHRVANRDLVISQLLRPQWWFVPVAAVMPIVFFVSEGRISFIGVASTLTAVLGVLLAPIRTVLGDWGFTVAAGGDGLRVRRGALEKRSQTVPLGRVQAVTVTWPWLWRSRGWVRVKMDIAGSAVSIEDNERTGTLLPVGTVSDARRLITETLPGFELTTVSISLAPRRARWLSPLAYRVLGYGRTEHAFVVQQGLITRELTAASLARVQSVRVRQGPLERRLGLASVFVDLAGGRSVTAWHRDVNEARELANDLAEQARAARRH
ncbi:PH domain-containing protein [Luedemannella helvata]|uniref:PH domain-containing protein n=1 Tax=Luedemannella helvata TaxID=349315 RepID=A0ABP4WV75_9ACTN